MNKLDVVTLAMVTCFATVGLNAQAIGHLLTPNAVPVLVQAYQDSDKGYNSGNGEIASIDSAVLGWNESYRLRCYWECYELTGDTRWLDKLVDHYSRIFSALPKDPQGQPMPWVTDQYSVALVRGRSLFERGKGTIEVPQPVIRDSAAAQQVPNRTYTIEFVDAGHYLIRDGQFSAPKAPLGNYKDGDLITIIPNVQVRIKGIPAQGDIYEVDTIGPHKIPYIVHQGMVLLPLAKFIEAATSKPELTNYKARATSFLGTIEQVFLKGNERYWLDTGQGAGAYRWTADPSERWPNRVLAHNQYLALGRVWLILGEISGNPLYRKRATAMALNFKRALRQVGDTYEWNWIDFNESVEVCPLNVEDSSHGSIDVEFMVDAARRNVVFTEADMARLARTLTTRMWNGDTRQPAFGANINASKGNTVNIYGWVDLARWDPRILDLCSAALAPGMAGVELNRVLPLAVTLQLARRHASR